MPESGRAGAVVPASASVTAVRRVLVDGGYPATYLASYIGTAEEHVSSQVFSVRRVVAGGSGTYAADYPAGYTGVPVAEYPLHATAGVFDPLPA